MRIGIAGSQNSHARVFAAMLNLEEGWEGRTVEGARVTHLLGDAPQEAETLAAECRIPNVCHTPMEMAGAVDAVLCLDRRGSRHAEQAAPYISAGLPLFVDKPLATDPAEAHAILDAAERSASLICSFSTIPLCADMRTLTADVAAMARPPRAVRIIAHADPACEYDGLAFYAIHAAEILRTLAGSGCLSVTSHERMGQVVAACRYEGGREGTLELSPRVPQTFQVTIHGTNTSPPMRQLDISDCYAEGLAEIVGILSGAKPAPTRRAMLEPVEIVAAIVRSIEEGREVPLPEFHS